MIKMDCNFKQSDRVTISISVSKSKLDETRGIVDSLLQETGDNSKAEKFMIRLLDAIDKKR